MNDKLCGTCKWFEDADDPGSVGLCTAIQCHLDHDSILAEKCSVLTCGVGSMFSERHVDAFLACAPTFGCVLWKPKPPAADPAPG